MVRSIPLVLSCRSSRHAERRFQSSQAARRPCPFEMANSGWSANSMARAGLLELLPHSRPTNPGCGYFGFSAALYGHPHHPRIHALSFFGLIVSGVAILLVHPRLYWGERGGVRTPSVLDLRLPFMLVGRSSWSQSVHFLSACVGVLSGLLYALSGLFTQHFRKNLPPVNADLAWGPIARGFESSAPQAADGRRVPHIHRAPAARLPRCRFCVSPDHPHRVGIRRLCSLTA